MDFSMKDFSHLKKVEQSIWSALVPFRNNRTEGALVVMACLRVARLLLDQYPKATRDVLTPLLVAFLKGEQQMPGVEDSSSPLWMPPANN